jgi:NAD(P)-dependent dehydrogenase (short-subunit alcohol dehydrogenase family)
MKPSTVLITGANRGLGLGLAEAYLADGWRVIALSRASSPGLEALNNGRLDIHRCDLTDDDQLQSVADALSGQQVDVLINNAGRMAKPRNGETRDVQGFGHFDRSLWHEVFDINLFTAVSLTERLVENLARSDRARIVTISSTLGSIAKNTSGGLYAYRASKAGVNAVTKSLAIDLADRGIIAIALHPGWVRTDMGGSGADIDVTTSVSGMKSVIDGLAPKDSGRFYAYDGSELPW